MSLILLSTLSIGWMSQGGHFSLLLLALFYLSTPSCLKVMVRVVHVIIVSAQVLLVLTLGLWTLDLGLTILARASGAGRPGWRSVTRLTLTTHLVLHFHQEIDRWWRRQDQRPRESPRSKQPLAPHTPPRWDRMRSGVRVADVRDLDILNKMDDIKIRVSYMKTRVRMDSWQTNLWFMLRCYDPLITNSFSWN